MTISFDLKKIKSKWAREGTLEQKEKVLEKIPKVCIDCRCQEFNYWGETSEEIVFICRKCQRYYSIPFNRDGTHFYFSY